MRGRLFAMLMLAAPAILAQPTIGPELRSDVFQSPVGLPDKPSSAVVISRNSSGFLIAWIEHRDDGHQHIFVARLNSEGQTLAANAIPLLESEDDAFFVTMASRGEQPLLSWIEKPSFSSQWKIAVARISQSLTSSRPYLLATLRSVPDPPQVAWDGSNSYVSSGSVVWRIGLDDTPAVVGGLGGPIDSIAASSSFVMFVGHTMQRTPCVNCPPHSICLNPCAPVRTGTLDIYTLYASIPGVCSTSRAFMFFHPLGAAAASDGKGALVVWPGGNVLYAARIDGSCASAELSAPRVIDILLPPASATTASNPQIAWDGLRFLVVYQVDAAAGEFEIRAAPIMGDDIGAPFVIARGTARRPVVVAVAPDRFLVGYEVVSSAGTQLAGRFIDFPHSRQRAVK